MAVFSIGTLLLLLLLLLQQQQFLAAVPLQLSDTIVAPSPPSCTTQCGNISIPFPFGIGAGCHRDGFRLVCNETYSSPKLFLDNTGLQVLDISLQNGTIHIDGGILNLMEATETIAGLTYMKWKVPLDDTLYVVSIDNFVAILGCGIDLSWSIPPDGEGTAISCNSDCASDQPTMATDGTCSGVGCCVTYSVIAYSNMFNIQFGTHAYYTKSMSLVVVDPDWWSDKENVMALQKAVASQTSSFGAGGGLPHAIPGIEVRTIVKWVFSNSSCKQKVLVTTVASVRTACAMRLVRVLQVTTACAREGTKATLTYDMDAKVVLLYAMFHMKKGIVVAIGICSGISVTLVIIGALLVRQKLKVWKVRQSRKFFFKQNRGLLLQQLVDKDIAEKMIFTLEELEKATNKFDEARKLGGGGHGTVYKGILSDQRVVAIKKSKIVIRREIDEFINEVAMLSQVNHRNVVKLFGCCLETEVPLLVYEFIANGTLSDHLHVDTPVSLSWKERVRIALETARSLSYLHSAATISIVHRDIKSANILLDETLTSKVSDFGTSRGIPIDQSGVNTAVQGTFGYLDPEYYHTWRLTEKSDVYSFGVVLVELLTRKKPCALLSSPGASLTAEFISLVNQDKLFEILDPQVVEEGAGEEAKEVAAMAVMCLSLHGEDRPTMRQVETRLETLQSGVHGVEINTTGIDVGMPMLNNSSLEHDNVYSGENLSRRRSMEDEFLCSMSFPR
ncbi:hypothetical protein EJB05_52459, partial [Eragrostis curvula]